MRRKLSLAALLGILGLGMAPAAGAQELTLADAEQGPRFLLASAERLLPLDADRTPALARRLDLRLEGVSLKQAVAEISGQAGLRLAFSDNDVPLGRRVHLRAEGITVAAALTDVLFGTGLDVVFGRQGGASLVKRRDRSEAQPGRIVGRVTNQEATQAVGGAEVFLEGTRWRALTDEDGQYVLAEVEPGSYTITARRIGYGRQSQPAAVADGQEIVKDFALTATPTQLEEIVTTGTFVPTEVKALPTPISVITADDIALRHPQSLLDVFRQGVPSAVAFDVPFYPAQTNFSVRGTSSLSAGGQMKIFIDGVEASNFSFSPVDPNSIERIEVVRGPQAATLYGADAAGGVVQIFTKRGDPVLERPQVDAGVELGVQQTPYDGRGGVLRQHYTGALRGGDDNTSYNFGGSYTRLDDYVPTDETSRQVTPSVYGGIQFTRGMVTADLTARYQHNELPPTFDPIAFTTGFVPNSRPRYENQEFSNETYGARITVTPIGWWRNQVTLGLDREGNEFRQTRPRLTTPDDTLLSVSNTDGHKISLGYNTSATGRLGAGVTASLTVGIDHYDNERSSTFASQAVNTDGSIQTSPPGLVFYNVSGVSNTGYFAQVQVDLNESVFLTAGMRGDDNSAFGRDVTTSVVPRVGVAGVRQIGQTLLKARASYGEAIRAPTPGLSIEFADEFSAQLENRLLRPEQQRGWDAGIDVVFGHRGSLSVTGFDQTAKDLIVFVTLAVDPVFTSQYQNIGRVSNSGLEVEGTLNVPPLELKAHYSYVRARISDLGPDVSESADLQVGERPLGGPEHTAGAALTIVPREGTSLLAGVTYVGSRREYDILAVNRCLGGTGPCPESFLSAGSTRDFITEYPGFAKLNATVTQAFGRHISGFVSVDNLTNNRASEAGTLRPVLGRLTVVGFRVLY